MPNTQMPSTPLNTYRNDINQGIYKAYDIRGVYGTELTDEVAYLTARALGELFQQEQSGKTLTLVVGEDMRLSSPALKQQVIKGLRDQGIHVVDVGLVSTPAFYFAVAKYKYDGGMMVSASHNPAKYNGLKMVRAGGVPVSEDTGIMTIRDRVVSGKPFTDAAEPGQVEQRTDIIKAHVDLGVSLAGNALIKPYTIVADGANAMGSTYLKELFTHVPGKKIEMNFTLDGTFPAHEADPFKEENNVSIMKRVVEEKADLGIVTDGDGDRIFFVDNEGQLIDPAIIRGLLAKVFLEEYPGAAICYDIRPGKITKDMIEAAGGKPSVTKVGHSLIKEQAIKEGAVFAGESSGHFFVKMDHGMFEEPCIVTLKLLQYFSRSDESIADQVRPYRKYFHSGEINSVVEDKAGMIEKLRSIYATSALNVSDLDGITIEYADYWYNVRPSNTESVLRLNLEAITADICKAKTEEILHIIRGN